MSQSSSKVVKNKKRSCSPIRFGIVGDFQMGKSTLLNCILGGVYASTGYGLSTTSRSTEYCWGQVTRILRKSTRQLVSPKRFFSNSVSKSDIDDYIYEVNNPVLEYVSFVDTPGINANEQDNSTAYAAISQLDAAIVIIQNKGLNTEIKSLLSYFESVGLPYIILMNCTIQQNVASWHPDSSVNTTILDNLKAQIKGEGFRPYALNGNIITPVNLFWYWYSIGGITSEDEELYDKQLGFIDRILSKNEDFDFKSNSNLLSLLDFLQSRILLSPLYVYRGLWNTTKNLPNISVAPLDEYYSAFKSTISGEIEHCSEEQLKLKMSIPSYEKKMEELHVEEPRFRDLSLQGVAAYLKDQALYAVQMGKYTHYKWCISYALNTIEESKQFSKYLQNLLKILNK